jgi:hypothetical protein
VPFRFHRFFQQFRLSARIVEAGSNASIETLHQSMVSSSTVHQHFADLSGEFQDREGFLHEMSPLLWRTPCSMPVSLMASIT